ncbi:hypothetical protein [Actinotalea fermentans]|uniref:Uncharacterized protein n=1 Tax=Actinotalea fermentans TaxID=43671 RepID=A0A511YU54_9CELL|nr:hypothetical protein [Actinotalea fermentans]KGM17162.1 hypothetical protein N867_09145 [Actinotalea fermentans ATCC 43279 = JCM 9966 = DSM 3133]GEN78724.1 hypothetical protein AFE02nite_04580 [Actinotalea fermentans]
MPRARVVPWPPAAASALGVLGVVVALAGPHGSGVPGGQDGPERAVLDLVVAREQGACDDYVASTTPFFRDDPYLGAPTCEDVAAQAARYAALGPVEVEVVGTVHVDVDTAEVETVERFRVGTDDEYAIALAYRTRLVDGVWAVDHVDLTVLPGD